MPKYIDIRLQISKFVLTSNNTMPLQLVYLHPHYLFKLHGYSTTLTYSKPLIATLFSFFLLYKKFRFVLFTINSPQSYYLFTWSALYRVGVLHSRISELVNYCGLLLLTSAWLSQSRRWRELFRRAVVLENATSKFQTLCAWPTSDVRMTLPIF